MRRLSRRITSTRRGSEWSAATSTARADGCTSPRSTTRPTFFPRLVRDHNDGAIAQWRRGLDHEGGEVIGLGDLGGQLQRDDLDRHSLMVIPATSRATVATCYCDQRAAGRDLDRHRRLNDLTTLGAGAAGS